MGSPTAAAGSPGEEAQPQRASVKRRRSWRALCVGVGLVVGVMLLHGGLSSAAGHTRTQPSAAGPHEEAIHAALVHPPPPPAPHMDASPTTISTTEATASALVAVSAAPAAPRYDRRRSVEVPLHRAVALLSRSEHLLRVCQHGARWLDTAVPDMRAAAARTRHTRGNTTRVAIVVHGLMRSLRCTVRAKP